MIKAILPGSFDPATYGHLDIIERASRVVDKLFVAVVYNSAKKTMFTVDERVFHLEYLTGHLRNVQVSSWDGLTAEYARKVGAEFIVRGIRSGSEFDYEAQIANVNRKVLPGIETVFINASPELSYLSSSVVKEVFGYGGDIDGMVHEYVRDRLNDKIRS